MPHTKIKNLLCSAIDSVSSSISDYARNPGKDFSRDRKLPPGKLMRFMIAEGSSTTKNELLDFFGMNTQSPSSSAFFQQREKLKPEALKKVFDSFTGSIPSCTDGSAVRICPGDISHNNTMFRALDPMRIAGHFNKSTSPIQGSPDTR